MILILEIDGMHFRARIFAVIFYATFFTAFHKVLRHSLFGLFVNLGTAADLSTFLWTLLGARCITILFGPVRE